MSFCYSRLPLRMPVSSGHGLGFGAGVCPGTAPGALIARFRAKGWLWLGLGVSLEGHLQGPFPTIAWARRGVPVQF
eukprot:6192098-Pleurochrysis_carterae.AAC.1